MINENIIKTFIYHVIPKLLSFEYDMDYIRFVFDLDTIKGIEKKVSDDKEYQDKGITSLKHLYNNQKEYLENDDIYIKVNDPDRFFNLLQDILNEYRKVEEDSFIKGENFLVSIWLRMGINDINNVEDFLEKQLRFLKNRDIISYNPSLLYENNEISLMYQNAYNHDLFETNNHLRFSVRSKDEKTRYDLPVIHYALYNDDTNPVCYLYGIQNIDDYNRYDENILEYLKEVKKDLRNKYVSKDILFTLGIFMDFMNQTGISEIRVPLYQVFNHTYHERLSKSIDEAYNSYGDEKENLEELFLLGDVSDKTLDYIHDKKMYNKFVGKEDIISKNKTERLVNTFISLQDILENIEIENDPLVQGDELIIKIKKKSGLLEKLDKKNKANT